MPKDKGLMYWLKLMFQDMLSHGMYDLFPFSLQSKPEFEVDSNRQIY